MIDKINEFLQQEVEDKFIYEETTAELIKLAD